MDESPLVYRATVVSDDSNFDLSTLLFHVTMYRQFARNVGTSANSALIRYYLPRLKLSSARERTPSVPNINLREHKHNGKISEAASVTHNNWLSML